MVYNKYLSLGLGNPFVEQGLIPLGINTWKGNNANKTGIVSLRYKHNGSIVIIATSGWGKSVLLKRIIDYVLGLYANKKAGLIIDTQGVDHRLLKFKNYKDHLFFKGETVQSLNNIKTYCPIFAMRKARKEDEIYGLTLNDLTPYDFLSADLSYNSVMEFFKIKQFSRDNRAIINKPNSFYEEFAKLKTSSKITNESLLDYPDSSAVNWSIKESLMRSFSWWAGYNPEDDEKPSNMPQEQWELHKRPPYFINVASKNHKRSFWGDYYNNDIVVNSFMDAKEEREGMTIYGGYVLRDAYDFCNINKERNNNFNGMLVCVEEANLFIDAEDIYLKKGSNFYLTELLCRGFKFEIFIVVNFQTIANVNRDIREHLTSGNNPVIIGNLNRRDREYLSDIFPSVKHLQLRDKVENLNWGAREWCVYYNDRVYDTFVPYPSLSMYHERRS